MSIRRCSIHVVSVVVIALLTTAASGGGCGDCDVASGVPGCSDPACQETVCLLDPFCCDVAWDAACVATAEAFCDCFGGTVDCNGNEVPDDEDIASGESLDCNGNGIPDECDVIIGTSPDCNLNFVPDECDVTVGTSADCNFNLIPDECEVFPDCNENGTPDDCDPDCDFNGIPDDCDEFADCNENGVPDSCDIAIPGNCGEANRGVGCSNAVCEAAVCAIYPFCCDTGWDAFCASQAVLFCAGTGDCDANGIPDECELTEFNDCNANGTLDACDVLIGLAPDCNTDGIPDDCQLAENDCNANGVPDECDLAGGTTAFWATSVIDFSSEFSTTNWAAVEALGPPDTFAYGDIVTAWAPLPLNGTLEFLTVGFDPPVVADGVTIRETFGNGFVYQVDLLDDSGVLHTVWTGVDPSLPGAPANFEITFPATAYLVAGVKIHVDTDHDLNAWEEIDAVRLHPATAPGPLFDCNDNGILDACDIAGGTSFDCDGSGTPDECEEFEDCDENGVPDGCDPDCNANGIADACDVAAGTPDCNGNLVPDECELDGNDCNANGIPDECDLVNGEGELFATGLSVPECIAPTTGTGFPAGFLVPDALDQVVYHVSPDGTVVSVFASSNLDTPIGARLVPNEFGGRGDRLFVTNGQNVGLGAANIDLVAVNTGGGVDVFADIASQPGLTGVEYVPLVIGGPNAGKLIVTSQVDDAGLDFTGAIYAVDEAGTVETLLPDAGGQIFTPTLAPSAFGAFGGQMFVFVGNGGGGQLSTLDLQTNTLALFATLPIEPTQIGLRQIAFSPPGWFAPLDPDLAGETIMLVGIAGSSTGGGMNGVIVALDATGAEVARLTQTSVGVTFEPRGLLFQGGELLISNAASGDIISVVIEDFAVADCNGNGIPDDCDIASGVSTDCTGNGVPDECETDCNENGVADSCEVAGGSTPDCNGNGVPDSCDLESGTSADCNEDGIPDDCQADCNGNGVADDCDISAGTSPDCNGNGTPDECEEFADCNLNDVPDECEDDCNENGVPDDCDITSGTSADCNGNGTPDECDAFADCNLNDIPDECEIDCNGNLIPDDCDLTAGTSLDCNGNGTPDECEEFADCNLNDVPDECETDCNENGVPDDCDIAAGTSPDCNGNGTPDECEEFADCNGSGIPDECELAGNDCNADGIPDDCELAGNDCNADGIPDDCQVAGNDCNGNAIPDDCELAGNDCNADGVPDECQLAENDCNANGVPDDCDVDCNENGTPDVCEAFDDCNQNGVPDECETLTDTDGDGTPNCADGCPFDVNKIDPGQCGCGVPDTDVNMDGLADCLDCNLNGIVDAIDIASGTSFDVNINGTPDECESGDEIEFQPPNVTQAVGAPNIEDVADFNLDGFNDVVIGIAGDNISLPGQAQVFLNLGNGPTGIWLGLAALPPLPVGADPKGVAAADFNGDAWPDFAMTGANDDTITIYINDGTGSAGFLGPDVIQLDAGSDPHDIAAADFVGDPRVDLATALRGPDQILFLENLTPSAFGSGAITVFGGGDLVSLNGDDPTAIDPEDIDNDKDTDLVVANTGSNTVEVLRKDPGGGFTTSAQLGTGDAPVDVDARDLNGDGSVDIATANFGDDTVSIFTQVSTPTLGGSMFITEPPVLVGLQPTAVKIADFNGDGDNDLVVTAIDALIGPGVQILNNAIGQTGVLSFSQPEGETVDADPNFVIATDLNNDGLADLVTVNDDDTEPTGGSVTGLISEIPFTCPDLDGDGDVDGGDVSQILAAWGACSPTSECPEDLDRNGYVNVMDVMEALFGGPCIPVIGCSATPIPPLPGGFRDDDDDEQDLAVPNLQINVFTADDSPNLTLELYIDIGCELFPIENGAMVDLLCDFIIDDDDDADDGTWRGDDREERKCEVVYDRNGTPIIRSETATLIAIVTDPAGQSAECQLDLCPFVVVIPGDDDDLQGFGAP